MLSNYFHVYFRCKLGTSSGRCKEKYLYANSLLRHQADKHHSREPLNIDNCEFPENLVRLNCKKCSHKILFNSREAMFDHLRAKHKDYSLDQVEFMCRICNWRDDTAPDIVEHAEKTHLRRRTRSTMSSTSRSTRCMSSVPALSTWSNRCRSVSKWSYRDFHHHRTRDGHSRSRSPPTKKYRY